MNTKDYWEIKKKQFIKSPFTNPETYLIFRWIKITNTTRKLIKEW